MGVLSVDALLPDLPLGNGVADDFRGDEDPNPTGVWMDLLPKVPPPDLMLEDLRTELPRGESSELSEMLDPVRDGGRDPFREPGAAEALRLVKLICSSA